MQQAREQTWTVGPSTFTACPEVGARLMRWNIGLAGGRSRPVLYWPQEYDFTQAEKIRGGNPLLFPFVARTFHKGEEGKWQDPSGVVRPMPRHGFARAGTFEVTNLASDGFTAVLVPTERACESYPFDYRFYVRYRFCELSFTVELNLENLGTQRIPWCGGHHFYFTLPWHAGLQRADYCVTIPAKKAFRHSANGALTAVESFEMATPCASADLIDRLHTQLKEGVARIGPNSGEEDIVIRVPHIGKTPPGLTFTTWTEAPSSPFYCLEPWMGLPNSPEHGIGLHWVSPGQTGRFFVEVSV